MSAPLTLRRWLESGPFGLTLSSGFFGFFAHCGMVSVLEEEGFYPERLSGSSAGALVAGMWAAGLRAASIREALFALRRSDFWDPGVGLGLLKGRRFRARLDAVLPVRDFAECRIPLAVSAFDMASRRTRVLGSGSLAPAIQASCTVPLLFQPLRLEGRWLLDGGVSDRAGIAGMPAGRRVLMHHLSSRSPWRRPGSPSLAIPRRSHLVALSIAGLPRVGPFRLQAGIRAFEAARDATALALERPVSGGQVHLETLTR